MKRLSRLTALLLTLVLILSPSLSAVAETVDAIKTRNAYFEAAKLALQNAILGIDEYADYRAIADLIEVGIFDEFYDSLEEDIQKEMLDLVIEKFWESCISSNKVGPFLPPVDVRGSAASSYSMRSMDVSVTDTTGDKEGDLVKNGLILKKSATPVANTTDKFTVELEAYVTGNVEIIENKSMIPADIVLVLDCSNSMVQNTMDDATGDTRAVALKKAVVAFIEDIRDKFNEETADHRITIYRYNNAVNAIPDNDTLKVTAENNNGWTYVNATGATHLINQVNSMGNNSGTHTDKGMDAAYNQIVTNYSYIGKAKNYERQKVVVVFTDGLPTDKSLNYQGGTVAVDAINKAYAIKNAVDDDGNPQNITVYSVAIFSGANPAAELRDGKTEDTRFIYDEDRINALMHSISSNYPEATAEDNNYKYDHNYYVTYGTGSNKGYYITAASTDDLIKKFKEISSNIETGKADQELGTSTTVKDIVTPQFMLPEGASNVRVKKVVATAYNSTTHEGTWDTNNAVTLPSSSVSINAADRSITVTGFDFAQNYVTQTARTDPENVVTNNYHGRKLVISFEVTANEDFLGGLDVPTNTNAGVYVPEGEGTKEVEVYTKPVVDIPVKPITPTVQDQHIYLSQPADLMELLGTDSQTNFLTYRLTENGTLYQVDGINNSYVDITYTFEQGNTFIAKYVIPKGATVGKFYDANGNEMTAEAVTSAINPVLTQDTEFTIKCDVKATSGDRTASATTQTVKATVYVYKPELTFEDSYVNYGDSVDNTNDAYYKATNYKERIAWKNYNSGNPYKTGTGSNTYAPAGNQMLDKTAPTLTLTYTADSTWITDGKVTGERDVNVNVTKVVSSVGGMVLTDYVVGAANTDVPDYTNGVRLKCEECGYGGTDAFKASLKNLNPEFVVHINNVSGNLQITKKVKVTDENGNEIDDDGKTIPSTVNQEYEFTVYLKDETGNDSLTGTYPLYIDGATIASKNVGNGDTFTLTDGQSAVIKGLPPRTTYGVVETLAAGFVTRREITESNGTAQKIDAGNLTDVVAFTNVYSPESLVIEKKVVNAAGTVVNDPNVDNQKFCFEVILPVGEYPYMHEGDTEPKYLTFTEENKDFPQQIEITGQGKVQINNLPVYEDYTITEVIPSTQLGYTFNSADDTNSSDDKVVNQTITGIIPDGGSNVVVTNKYTTYNLTIDKVIEGAETDDANVNDDIFTVNVKLPAGKYWVTGAQYGNGKYVDFAASGTDVTVTVGTNTVIRGIPHGAGYEVYESDMPDGYKLKGYNNTNSTAIVTSESMTGNSTVTITNTYTTGTLTINKKVDVDFIANDTFEFTVNLPDGTYPATIAGTDVEVVVTNNEAKVVGAEEGTNGLTIMKDQSIVIKRIPANAEYAVNEVVDDNYNTTVKKNAETVTPETPYKVTGSMALDGQGLVIDQVVEYTNNHKTGDLKIIKRVDNVTSSEEFYFNLNFVYNSKPVTGDFNTIKYNANGVRDVEIITLTPSTYSITLAGGESFEIKGLPVGAEYEIQEVISYNPNYNVNIRVQEGSIEDNVPKEVTFVNTHSTGALKISKTVVSADKYEPDTTKSFAFKVKLTTDGYIAFDSSYDYKLNGVKASTPLSFTNGESEVFYLKHGEYITILDLPIGVGYTVTETPDKYYTMTSTGAKGTIAALPEGVDAGDTTNIAAFTNTHKTGSVEFTKIREYYGRTDAEDEIPWYVASQFAFQVTLKDKKGYDLTSDELSKLTCTITKPKVDEETGEPIVDEETGDLIMEIEKSVPVTSVINLEHNWKATIDNLPPGTTYTITESVPTGYLCDHYHQTDKIAADVKNSHTFTNTYRPAALAIIKKIEDEHENPVADKNVLDDKFKFRVWLPEGEYPVTVTGDVTCVRETAGSQKETPLEPIGSNKWNFNAAGYLKDDEDNFTSERVYYIFTYKGASSNISINGIPFNSPYYVEEIDLPYGYTLKLKEGQQNPIDSELVLEKEEKTFTNVYTTEALTIKKDIEGGDENTTNDTFRVYVELPPGKYSINDAEAVDFVGYVDITGSGTVEISGIPTGAPYKVYESEELPNGYKLIGYEPAADNDGYVTGNLNADSEVKITNKYSSGSLTVSKAVVGAYAPADEFKFTVNLYKNNKAPLEAQEGTFSYTITDKDNKKVREGSISGGSDTIDLMKDQKFTITNIPDDTFYTIVETRNPDYSIKIDGNEYAAGSISGTIKAPENKDHVYTNTYNYGRLTITKRFENCTPEPNETFIFTVKEGNELVLEIVMTGADFATGEHSVVIDHLPINKTYTVTENDGWSWRYDVTTQNPASTMVTHENYPEWIFTNTKEKDQWLDDNASADNNMTTGKRE